MKPNPQMHPATKLDATRVFQCGELLERARLLALPTKCAALSKAIDEAIRYNAQAVRLVAARIEQSEPKLYYEH